MTLKQIPPSNPHYQRLIQNLKRLLTQCQDFVTILKKEREALTNGQAHDIDEMSHAKSQALAELSQSEKERRALTASLSKELNLSKPTESLTTLISFLGHSNGVPFVFLYQRIIHVLKDVVAINHHNASLARHALYYHQNFLSFVMGQDQRSERQTYGPDGQADPSSVPILGQEV